MKSRIDYKAAGPIDVRDARDLLAIIEAREALESVALFDALDRAERGTRMGAERELDAIVAEIERLRARLRRLH